MANNGKWVPVNFTLPKSRGGYEVKIVQQSGAIGETAAYYVPPEEDPNNMGKMTPPKWNAHGQDITEQVTHWRKWNP